MYDTCKHGPYWPCLAIKLRIQMCLTHFSLLVLSTHRNYHNYWGLPLHIPVCFKCHKTCISVEFRTIWRSGSVSSIPSRHILTCGQCPLVSLFKMQGSTLAQMVSHGKQQINPHVKKRCPGALPEHQSKLGVWICVGVILSQLGIQYCVKIITT